MQIREIDGFVAHCEAKGVQRDVNLFMMLPRNLPTCPSRPGRPGMQASTELRSLPLLASR